MQVLRNLAYFHHFFCYFTHLCSQPLSVRTMASSFTSPEGSPLPLKVYKYELLLLWFIYACSLKAMARLFTLLSSSPLSHLRLPSFSSCGVARSSSFVA